MGIVLADYLALTAITDPDPAAAKRAFDAMMEMKNIDIAASSNGWGLHLQRAASVVLECQTHLPT
jgi:hypothetical protein